MPLIARQAKEDIEIRGFTIPSGAGVVIAASMVHRDPAYWDDPEGEEEAAGLGHF